MEYGTAIPAGAIGCVASRHAAGAMGCVASGHAAGAMGCVASRRGAAVVDIHGGCDARCTGPSGSLVIPPAHCLVDGTQESQRGVGALSLAAATDRLWGVIIITNMLL